jgi:DNA-binding cell septation regulator SpoVG
MGLLQPMAIQGYKDYTRATIAYAQYKVDDVYYRVTDANLTKSYLADGRLAVSLLIDHTVPGNVTIKEIRLFDTNNNLWLVKPENIMREDVTAGVLYRFTFDFTEN